MHTRQRKKMKYKYTFMCEHKRVYVQHSLWIKRQCEPWGCVWGSELGIKPYDA